MGVGSAPTVWPQKRRLPNCAAHMATGKATPHPLPVWPRQQRREPAAVVVTHRRGGPCAACPSASHPSWRSGRWPRPWRDSLICRPACQFATTIVARRVVVLVLFSSFRVSLARAIWTTARAACLIRQGLDRSRSWRRPFRLEHDFPCCHWNDRNAASGWESQLGQPLALQPDFGICLEPVEIPGNFDL